jgi:hypothetical protein
MLTEIHKNAFFAFQILHIILHEENVLDHLVLGAAEAHHHSYWTTCVMSAECFLLYFENKLGRIKSVEASASPTST